MKKQVGVALFSAWVAIFGLATTSEAVKFRYENLGTLGGDQSYTSGFSGKEADINNSDQVVGKSFTAGGVLHAFVKSPGQTMVDLGALTPASELSVAPCLNNSGTIGGWYDDGFDHACTWTPLPGGTYEFADLGGDSSSVHGINDAGYLVGRGLASGGGIHAHVKPPGEDALDLGTIFGDYASVARDINNDRTIVGYSSNFSGPTACYWSPDGAGYTEAADLFGVAGNSEAYAINNLGQAVGGVQSDTIVAVLKSPGLDLQYLGELVPGGYSTAYDINDSGWVVGFAQDFGTNAFLWTPSGGMQNLNNLVVNLPAGVKLLYAMAINKRGEIAGYTANGVFRLTPIIEPPFSLLLLD